MSVNISGLLRNAGKKSLRGLFEDDNKQPMSDKEARAFLAECQSKGWKLIPCGNCEGFDHFGGGCPGHETLELLTQN